MGSALHKAVATENDGFRRAAEGLDRPAYVDEHRLGIDAATEAVWSAVIGTRGHAVAVRRMLRQVAGRVRPRAGAIMGRNAGQR